MRVKATAEGYIGHKRRRVGEVFDLVAYKGKNKEGKVVVISEAQQFSKKWMVEVKKGKYREPEPEDELEEYDDLSAAEVRANDQDVI